MAEQSIAGVPSLSSRSKPILTNKENVAEYLLTFLFANPGNTSSVNEGEMMSFRKLVASLGTRKPDLLADKISEMLSISLQHYFPNTTFQVNCHIEEEQGFGEDGKLLGTYGLVIAIRDGNGDPFIPARHIRTSKNGETFSFLD